MRSVGLVVFARSLNPIPSRTRPLNSSAPMVLCLKTWESRSLPGLQNACVFSTNVNSNLARVLPCNIGKLPYYSPWLFFDAGWSSPVARQAHNLKVVSSNLAPASNSQKLYQCLTVYNTTSYTLIIKILIEENIANLKSKTFLKCSNNIAL